MATFYRVRLGWFKKDRIQDRDEIDCMANGLSIVWFSRTCTPESHDKISVLLPT